MEKATLSSELAVATASAVFIDSNLETHLALIVTAEDTVGDLKGKIRIEHPLCFPNIGEITIHALKVRRKAHLYYLSDSMLVKHAFSGIKGTWFLHMYASSKGLVGSQAASRENHLRAEKGTTRSCIMNVPSAEENLRDVVTLPLPHSKMLSVRDNLSLPHVGSGLIMSQHVPSGDQFSSRERDREVNLNHPEANNLSDEVFKASSDNKMLDSDIPLKYDPITEENGGSGVHVELEKNMIDQREKVVRDKDPIQVGEGRESILPIKKDKPKETRELQFDGISGEMLQPKPGLKKKRKMEKEKEDAFKDPVEDPLKENYAEAHVCSKVTPELENILPAIPSESKRKRKIAAIEELTSESLSRSPQNQVIKKKKKKRCLNLSDRVDSAFPSKSSDGSTGCSMEDPNPEVRSLKSNGAFCKSDTVHSSGEKSACEDSNEESRNHHKDLGKVITAVIASEEIAPNVFSRSSPLFLEEKNCSPVKEAGDTNVISHASLSGTDDVTSSKATIGSVPVNASVCIEMDETDGGIVESERGDSELPMLSGERKLPKSKKHRGASAKSCTQPLVKEPENGSFGNTGVDHIIETEKVVKALSHNAEPKLMTSEETTWEKVSLGPVGAETNSKDGVDSLKLPEASGVLEFQGGRNEMRKKSKKARDADAKSQASGSAIEHVDTRDVISPKSDSRSLINEIIETEKVANTSSYNGDPTIVASEATKLKNKPMGHEEAEMNSSDEQHRGASAKICTLPLIKEPENGSFGNTGVDQSVETEKMVKALSHNGEPTIMASEGTTLEKVSLGPVGAEANSKDGVDALKFPEASGVLEFQGGRNVTRKKSKKSRYVDAKSQVSGSVIEHVNDTRDVISPNSDSRSLINEIIETEKVANTSAYNGDHTIMASEATKLKNKPMGHEEAEMNSRDGLDTLNLPEAPGVVEGGDGGDGRYRKEKKSEKISYYTADVKSNASSIIEHSNNTGHIISLRRSPEGSDIEEALTRSHHGPETENRHNNLSQTELTKPSKATKLKNKPMCHEEAEINCRDEQHCGASAKSCTQPLGKEPENGSFGNTGVDHIIETKKVVKALSHNGEPKIMASEGITLEKVPLGPVGAETNSKDGVDSLKLPEASGVLEFQGGRNEMRKKSKKSRNADAKSQASGSVIEHVNDTRGVISPKSDSCSLINEIIETEKVANTSAYNGDPTIVASEATKLKNKPMGHEEVEMNSRDGLDTLNWPEAPGVVEGGDGRYRKKKKSKKIRYADGKSNASSIIEHSNNTRSIISLRRSPERSDIEEALTRSHHGTETENKHNNLSQIELTKPSKIKTLNSEQPILDEETDKAGVSEVNAIQVAQISRTEEAMICGDEKVKRKSKKTHIPSAKNLPEPLMEQVKAGESGVNSLQVAQISRAEETADYREEKVKRKSKKTYVPTAMSPLEPSMEQHAPSRDDQDVHDGNNLKIHQPDENKKEENKSSRKRKKLRVEKTGSKNQLLDTILGLENGTNIRTQSSEAHHISETVGSAQIPLDTLECDAVERPSKADVGDDDKVNFIEFFVPKVGQHESVDLAQEIEAKETQKFPKEKTSKKTRKLNMNSEGSTVPDLECLPSSKEKKSRDRNSDLVQVKGLLSKEDPRKRAHLPNENDRLKNSSYHNRDSFEASNKDSGECNGNASVIGRDPSRVSNTTSFKKNYAAQAASSASTKSLEDSPSLLNRYSVGIRKAPSKELGEVLNNSKREKSLLATADAIFKDMSNEGSEDEVNNSEATTGSLSDNSSSSAYSDGEYEEIQSMTMAPKNWGNLDSRKNGGTNKENGGNNILQSQLADKKKMNLGMILRNSNSYRKAKLTASRSKLEDSESQTVDFVLDSQVNLTTP